MEITQFSCYNTQLNDFHATINIYNMHSWKEDTCKALHILSKFYFFLWNPSCKRRWFHTPQLKILLSFLFKISKDYSWFLSFFLTLFFFVVLCFLASLSRFGTPQAGRNQQPLLLLCFSLSLTLVDFYNTKHIYKPFLGNCLQWLIGLTTF